MTPSEFINRFLNALFVEHPLHSLTVHFPIALSAVGVLFLVLALWKRNEWLERTAFYNITLVAISSVVAGFTGYRDHIVRFDGDTPLANVKMFLGVTLFLIATITAIARWRQPQIIWKPATMLLYLAAFIACFLLASTLGFIGGVILYGF